MAYVPINQILYLAAFDGAIAGMAASMRTPKSTSQATYLDVAAIAGAWAEAFDASWNNAAALNDSQIARVSNLSQQTWIARAPSGGLSVALVSAATYVPQTNALATIINAADAYLTQQGITPAGSTLAGDVAGPLDANYVQAVSFPTSNTGFCSIAFNPATVPGGGAATNVEIMAQSTAQSDVGNYGGGLNLYAGRGGDVSSAFDGTVQIGSARGKNGLDSIVWLSIGGNQFKPGTIGGAAYLSPNSFLTFEGDPTPGAPQGTGAIRLPRPGTVDDTSGIRIKNAVNNGDVCLLDVDQVGATDTTEIGRHGSGVRLLVATSEVFHVNADRVFIANSAAPPGANPVDGGYLYVQGGALKYRGSAGTVTTLAPA